MAIAMTVGATKLRALAEKVTGGPIQDVGHEPSESGAATTEEPATSEESCFT